MGRSAEPSERTDIPEARVDIEANTTRVEVAVNEAIEIRNWEIWMKRSAS